MHRPISVSIITPCYNGSRYLASTLESAIRQTYSLLELLVVHDGSTDDSIEVAERVAVAARLGFQAAVSRDEALCLTRDWAKSARLI